MKRASSMLVAVGLLALAAPALVPSASAEVIRRSETIHRGGFGHGCKVVRTVREGFHGRSVVVRKVCR